MRILLMTDWMTPIRDALNTALPDHDIVTAEPDQLPDEIARANVLIPARNPIAAVELQQATNLQLIQQFGAGVDAVDLEGAAALGIPVANVPSGPSDLAKAVAEFALFHMIGAGRRFATLQQALAKQSIQTPFGASVFEARVCIIGVGGIGSALARLLQAFDCDVVGVKRTPDDGLAKELGMERIYPSNQLREAVRDCGFVVVAVPLTEETTNLITTEVIEAMPRGSVLVNVARGPVVNEDALMAALSRGHLASAGLDVFWDEPVDPTHPVFKKEVFTTPHCASSCDLFLRGTARVVRGNIERLERGEALEHQLN